MRGVSRASLAEVRERLDSVLTGGSKKDAALQRTVAEELFAVVGSAPWQRPAATHAQ